MMSVLVVFFAELSTFDSTTSELRKVLNLELAFEEKSPENFRRRYFLFDEAWRRDSARCRLELPELLNTVG